MAQVLKLKRTAVNGKIPTTSQLELGELAINTYDGRIFFEKDNGTPSISEILVANTTNPVTGSLTLNGNISATNITLSGDLVVEGTTTTIDSTTLNIGDNIIELNYGGSSTSGGIYVKDATGASTTSGSLLWDATNDYWKLGKLGSESEVITLSNLTTNLPSGIVSSSSQITITESQISDLSHTEIPAGTISGSSQLNGTTLTNMIVSGSFSGDGSGLTNVSADISEVATVAHEFTNLTSVTVSHNFNTKNILVSVYDENDSYFIPTSIVTTNLNSVTVGFSGLESGRVVVAKGGHIVSGSADNSSKLNGQSGSYYLDYNNFINIPSGIISSSAQIDTLFNIDGLISSSAQVTELLPSGVISGSSQITITESQISDLSHYNDVNVKSKLNFEEVLSGSYHSGDQTFNDNVTIGGNLIVGGTTTTIDATVVSIGDNIIELNYGGSELSGGILVKDATGASTISGSLLWDSSNDYWKLGKLGSESEVITTSNVISNLPNGVVSGSSQITDLTTHKETVSGASSYTVTHNLNESYPIVQAWNTSTSQQEVPTSISSNSANQVTVVFSTTFAGVIIVKK